MGVMQSIGDLLIAPVQPWDALICTSVAVKTAVEYLLNTWADYLAQRTGGRPNIQIKLPIIPLGVDCNAFAVTHCSWVLYTFEVCVGPKTCFCQQLCVNGRGVSHNGSQDTPPHVCLERWR